MKLQPSTYLRESCASVREGRCEALTAAHVAGAIEHRKNYRLGRRDFPDDRRQHLIHRNGEMDYGPTVSKNPGTHARTLPGPGRSLFYPGVVLRGRAGKVEDTEACDVRNREVRSRHSSNEGSEQRSDPAELLERRPRPKGKLGDPTTLHTLRWKSVSHGIKRLRQILPLCTTVRPKGGAGCVSAHGRIRAGGPGKPGSLPRSLNWLMKRARQNSGLFVHWRFLYGTPLFNAGRTHTETSSTFPSVSKKTEDLLVGLTETFCRPL